MKILNFREWVLNEENSLEELKTKIGDYNSKKEKISKSENSIQAKNISNGNSYLDLHYSISTIEKEIEEARKAGDLTSVPELDKKLKEFKKNLEEEIKKTEERIRILDNV